MKIDFFNEQVPDATTLCKFRKLLVDNGIQKLYFKAISDFLQEHGYMLKGGTIVDATIINASPSTKNAAKQRDPEMHQTKKGKTNYFMADYFARYFMCPIPYLIEYGIDDELTLISDHLVSQQAAHNTMNNVCNRRAVYGDRIFDYEKPLVDLFEIRF